MEADSIEKIWQNNIKSLLNDPDFSFLAEKYRELKQLREVLRSVEERLDRLVTCGSNEYIEGREGLRKARELVEEELRRLEKQATQLILKTIVKKALGG